MFAKYDSKGKVIRYKNAVIACTIEERLTEQAHAKECDINNIIKKHGVDMIQKTALLQSQEFQFDDVTGNDFQEAMFKVNKARESFESLPSAIRDRFDHSPAKFLDYVHDPNNQESLVEMGLAERFPTNQPVEVVITNAEPGGSEPVPETPPE